jgi:hypothetical protein
MKASQMVRIFAVVLAALLAMPGSWGGAQVAAPNSGGAAVPAPQLTLAFSIRIEVAAPVEVGTVPEGRRRFIPITGGRIIGPRLSGVVLPGGGDWQTIGPGGVTRIEARYFLRTDDGTVIEITNPGVRVASAEVTEALARGERVAPDAYYFRTQPSFIVAGDTHSWLRRSLFVGRGIRHPDHVILDVYIVE